MHALKIILGDRFSEGMEEIYKITIKFILENVCKTYARIEKEDECKKDSKTEET